jgi:hypothetical protein
LQFYSFGVTQTLSGLSLDLFFLVLASDQQWAAARCRDSPEMIVTHLNFMLLWNWNVHCKAHKSQQSGPNSGKWKWIFILVFHTTNRWVSHCTEPLLRCSLTVIWHYIVWFYCHQRQQECLLDWKKAVSLSKWGGGGLHCKGILLINSLGLQEVQMP